MYKIKGTNSVDSRFLIEYTAAKEKIVTDMLVGFAEQMYKRNCVGISETTGNRSGGYLQQDETEFTIEGYVMTPVEFKEAIDTLRMIKSGLQEPFRGYANRLESILTKEPIS